MKRVVITGAGVVSSSGHSPDAVWENVINGKHGFSKIDFFDTEDFDVKYAAGIKNWDPTEHGIDKKEARRMDIFTQYGVAAANQAIENAGDFAKDTDPFRIGVIIGSGIGGFSSIEQEHAKFIEKGRARVSVFLVPMMITNMLGGMIAIQNGFKGDNFATVSACSSGNHAIGEAFRKIKHGYLDACLAGGSEGVMTEFAFAGFNNMRTLSRATDMDRLSVPFDKERCGFVMGEGAGVVVLEELEHAQKRGAHIYAEIVGYGATDDAHHITSPDPEGKGASRAMINAVEDAGITVRDIDYINAHGTSTELNDKYETAAIKSAFGENAYNIPVSSTKSVTGHLMGAAGALEATICAKALETGVIPPTTGYKVPDPDCDLDYVTDGARKKDIKYAMSNAFGFGGHNGVIVFKKYEGK